MRKILIDYAFWYSFLFYEVNEVNEVNEGVVEDKNCKSKK